MSTAQPAAASWGRYPRVCQQVVHLRDRFSAIPEPPPGRTLLPYGNGRSYGDSCLNDGGYVLHTRGLDRFIAFDSATGVLRCEAGILLDEILKRTVAAGWFLPVTPGTRFATLGGAIANDVHGKNHHRAGTFGAHVRSFELARTDGTRRICSPAQNADWFGATIGGLGLTGVLTWAEIQLRPIHNPYIESEAIPFRTLQDFLDLSAASDEAFEYTVAWLDCAAAGAAAGRGVFFRGNHAPAGAAAPGRTRERAATVPAGIPFSLVSNAGVRAFNALYYRAHSRARSSLTHYAPFFYPLDNLREWNRIYGPRGFLQYQFVVPHAHATGALHEILERVATSASAPFLAVLKVFGPARSPGMLSFPRPGVTLAMDFPMRGDETLRLLAALDAIVAAAGGAIYPAKDARMSGALFRAAFPGWTELAEYVDPRISSSFWRRVTSTA